MSLGSKTGEVLGLLVNLIDGNARVRLEVVMALESIQGRIIEPSVGFGGWVDCLHIISLVVVQKSQRLSELHVFLLSGLKKLGSDARAFALLDMVHPRTGAAEELVTTGAPDLVVGLMFLFESMVSKRHLP